MGKNGICQKDAQRYLELYNQKRNTSYQLGGHLGDGGSATVYRLDKVQPPMAVKMCQLWDSPGSKAACEREIEMIKTLGEHRHIVSVLDHGYITVMRNVQKGKTASREPVFLMFMPEYLDLFAWVEKKKTITEEELRQLAIHICKALERCAEKFIFHCDVKLGNIFVDQGQKDKGSTFLLGDFNFSTFVNPYVPQPVLYGGTPGYVAPEIEDLRPGEMGNNDYGPDVRKAAGERPHLVEYDSKLINADVFSLGVTLYHLLAFELPDVQAKMGMKGRKLLKVSEDFEKIIRRAVRYDPHERYASAREMRMDLEKLTASRHTVVFEANQFLQAKEFLLEGKFDRAEHIAKLGVAAGEPRCELLLAYIHCIRASRAAGDCSLEEYRRQLTPVMGELAEVYRKHKLPMAQFLHSVICQQAQYQEQFLQNVRLAAEKDCVPAMFMWGKILNQEAYGCAGRTAEGREYVYRAAEKEFQPALRYVKKYCRKYRDDYSEELEKRLERVDVNEPAEIFEGVVKYL